eukprot:TRINITY_DN19953_c0_g1_i1.p1 TRINITY_DN19953_c0_g1~~TRINITY_DN19953_c0_g1_i1.p1  ORF type:complete len:857 (-),score=153.45 TRINITY_DN19953_c0_g1_i1:262-2832(-)
MSCDCCLPKKGADKLRQLLAALNDTFDDNDGEQLQVLQRWVHEQKEAHELKEASALFRVERGVEAVVSCMRRNPRDTVVVSRSLDLLAGESGSNGALPLLEDGAAVAKLEELGFASLVLDALRLPDLQSVSRGLGCRVLLHLDSFQAADSTVVEVLLRQVIAVGRPFAFQLLAKLATSQESVRERMREVNQQHALARLLLRFAEAPAELSPPDNPAASGFFLGVWTIEELRNELETLDVKPEVLALLETADAKDVRKSYSIYFDLVFPMVDGFLDACSATRFYQDGDYDFFAMAASVLALTTVASSLAMFVRSPPRPTWKLILNIVSLGNFATVDEVWLIIQRGFKSDELIGLRMIKGVESFVSFSISAYWVIMCGYLEGFETPGGVTLASRWASMGSSLLSIPLGCYYIVMARTGFGKRQFGVQYTAHIKSWSSRAMLFLFQAAEIWSFTTVLIFQLAARPNTTRNDLVNKLPIVICFLAQALVIFLGLLIQSRGCPSLSAMTPLGLNLVWNVGGGATSELGFISRGIAILRPVTYAVLWGVIAFEFSKKPLLLDHFRERGSCIALLIIAGSSSVLLFCTTLQQFLVGRWSFDFHDGSSEAKPLLKQAATSDSLAKATSRKLAGVFLTAASNYGHGVVKERWLRVHQSLEDATARIKRDVFVSFHKTLDNASVENEDYLRFVDELFTAACALMYPKDATDLGKHCFGYATLIHDEFHEGNDAVPDKLGLMSTPAISWFDPLQTLRDNIEADWSQAEKDAKGYVQLGDFQAVLLARHEAKLGKKSGAKKAYRNFLEKAFNACRLLEGSQRLGLDKHGFFYASMFGYEFYFADAREKVVVTRCGAGTPVADSFGINR